MAAIALMTASCGASRHHFPLGVILTPRKVQVKAGGEVRVRVRCSATCRGTLQLISQRNHRSPITAAVPFGVTSRHGCTVTVVVRLDRTALASFRASGDHLFATAVMRYASGYGHPGSTTFTAIELR